VDGCFDFAHHGHAGAMLQARRLGTELVVGVHSDEAILQNKGPTVMTLKERIAAVEACRWVTKAIPDAPYVTYLPWISHYGCKFVVHGDDITSDSGGEDCYRFVKAAGRFKVVKRTPGISTTDLVGRMLLCTRSHFIFSLEKELIGEEGPGGELERKARGEEMGQRIREYASDESGKNPSSEVWTWTPSKQRKRQSSSSGSTGRRLSHVHTSIHDDPGKFGRMVSGKEPRKGQRVVYVDGGFDLFSSGHIEFLRSVIKIEDDLGKSNGWFTEAAKKQRIEDSGEDYPPAYVIAGVHDDEVINYHKGVNYPIMNIFERGLCVLQCKVGIPLPTSTTSTNSTLPVCPRAHLLCPFHPHIRIPHLTPLWTALPRLPRAYRIHAPHHARPL
jgi:ethanolamine-phosphate cytidylyltransferase